jgi:hypothetical protein
MYQDKFAWFVLYNETVNRIDHINRIKTDNRPANLSVTTSQNSMNMSNTRDILTVVGQKVHCNSD